MQTLSTSILHTIIMNAMQMLKDEWKTTKHAQKLAQNGNRKDNFWSIFKTGKYIFFCNIPFYYFEGDDIFSSTITENQTQVKEKNTTENV